MTELLQFYAQPRDTLIEDILFPTITDTLIFDIYVMLNDVKNGDKIGLDVYSQDETLSMKHFDYFEFTISTNGPTNSQNSIAGVWSYFLEFNYDELFPFGRFEITLFINGTKQPLFSKFFIQDGKK